MAVLLTGCAGFIGMHVALALLARGEAVVGIDNLNDYYDILLKRARLDRLAGQEGFRFVPLDITDLAALERLCGEAGAAPRAIVHLAAQAGVRHSLERPFDYLHSNLAGHLTMLELGRRLPGLEHLVYASSSSVYGANRKVPFSIEDRVDQPVSLYAASKRADELMSATYAHLYGLKQTGLRFFTVYGPWGRPDMAYWGFTAAIAEGRPITLYNQGLMRRDFTFIDDIVAGVLAALDRPPTGLAPPHRLYNLGNNRPVELLRMVEILERAVGRPAERRLAPMQPGDVVETFADIDATTRDLDWRPTIALEEGLDRFVAWWCQRYRA